MSESINRNVNDYHESWDNNSGLVNVHETKPTYDNGIYFYRDTNVHNPLNSHNLAHSHIPVGEDLHDALVELLNLILKRENLNGELVASATKFDDEVAIPLHSIASHRDVKMLNPTEEQLIKALSATKYIYDEVSGLVKTGVKIERKTVILSNVPQVEEEEIRSFFGEPTKITEISKVIENTWFVTFDSEDSAVDAVTSSKRKLLGGVKINIAMKNDHLVKTTTSNISYVPYYKPHQYQQGWSNRYPRYNEAPMDRQYTRGPRYQGSFNPRGRKPRHPQSRGPKESGSNSIQVLANGSVILSKKSNQSHTKNPNTRRTFNGKKSEKKQVVSSFDPDDFPPLGNSETLNRPSSNTSAESQDHESTWIPTRQVNQVVSEVDTSSSNPILDTQSTPSNVVSVDEDVSSNAQRKAWADIAKAN